MAEQLQQAGHNVQVVSNDVDLALEMHNQQFDVVVAPYSKRDEVEAQSAEIASTPTGCRWLKVAQPMQNWPNRNTAAPCQAMTTSANT